MDYRIDFSAAEDSGIAALMRSLDGISNRIEATDGGLRIDGRTFFRAVSETSPALETTGATDEALFHLLERYFALVSGREEGALVTVLGSSELTMVAITNEDDPDLGRTPLAFVVAADQLLANEQIFGAAWPSMMSGGDTFEEFEDDQGDRVTTQNEENVMIFNPLLGGLDEETESVSFLVFGASPQQVMENLVAVSSYVAADPEFLITELDQSEGSIEAVSFDTSDGPAVELRLPLAQRRIAEAIEILSRNADSIPNARIFYIAEILDSEEAFFIQMIEADGVLAAPRRITLN